MPVCAGARVPCWAMTPALLLQPVDPDAFAGRTVTLNFTATENSSRQTSFVLDDTAVTIT